MVIDIEQNMPSAKLFYLGDEQIKSLDIAEYIKDKSVVIIGVPGAYTPVCTMNHLPGFVGKADEIKAEGADEIICIAPNDPFVVKRWKDELDPENKITILSDGNLELTKALGMELDASGLGLGQRSQRYSMIVKNGVIKTRDVEDEASTVSVSGAESCLMTALPNIRAA